MWQVWIKRIWLAWAVLLAGATVVVVGAGAVVHRESQLALAWLIPVALMMGSVFLRYSKARLITRFLLGHSPRERAGAGASAAHQVPRAAATTVLDGRPLEEDRLGGRTRAQRLWGADGRMDWYSLTMLVLPVMVLLPTTMLVVVGLKQFVLQPGRPIRADWSASAPAPSRAPVEVSPDLQCRSLPAALDLLHSRYGVDEAAILVHQESDGTAVTDRAARWSVVRQEPELELPGPGEVLTLTVKDYGGDDVMCPG